MKLLKGCAFYGPNNNKYSHTDENCENHVAVLTLFQSDSNIIYPHTVAIVITSQRTSPVGHILVNATSCQKVLFPARPDWAECLKESQSVVSRDYISDSWDLILFQDTTTGSHSSFKYRHLHWIPWPTKAHYHLRYDAVDTHFLNVKLFSILP